MAVGTHHIALGNLGEQVIPGHEHRSRRGQAECLQKWITVVEVHLVRSKVASAVGTGDSPDVAEQVSGSVLARSDSRNLLCTMALVVRDVVRPLLPDLGHNQE